MKSVEEQKNFRGLVGAADLSCIASHVRFLGESVGGNRVRRVLVIRLCPCTMLQNLAVGHLELLRCGELLWSRHLHDDHLWSHTSVRIHLWQDFESPRQRNLSALKNAATSLILRQGNFKHDLRIRSIPH